MSPKNFTNSFSPPRASCCFARGNPFISFLNGQTLDSEPISGKFSLVRASSLEGFMGHTRLVSEPFSLSHHFFKSVAPHPPCVSPIIVASLYLWNAQATLCHFSFCRGSFPLENSPVYCLCLNYSPLLQKGVPLTFPCRILPLSSFPRGNLFISPLGSLL